MTLTPGRNLPGRIIWPVDTRKRIRWTPLKVPPHQIEPDGADQAYAVDNNNNNNNNNKSTYNIKNTYNNNDHNNLVTML
jgi:hypothetical protein